MSKVLLLFLGVAFLGSIALADGKTNAAQRLRFVPAPSTPRWTCLRAFPEPDSETLSLHAWAGIGNTFPVCKEDSPTLFEVLVKAGDDDHLSLEILSKDGTQPAELRRDDSAKFKVAGIEYEIYYPSVDVASTAKRRTTNTAMLIVYTSKALGNSPRAPNQVPEDTARKLADPQH
jgi:hypothetical protein